MTFIAGHYSATFTPVGGVAASIGGTEDGFELIEALHSDPIKTDEFGETTVDAINAGSDVSVRLTWVEYDLIKAALFAGHERGEPGPYVGRLMSSLAGTLILTPVPLTTAAVESGTWTFHLCYVENDVTIPLSYRLRKGPVTFRCLPDPANDKKFYSIGAGSV